MSFRDEVLEGLNFTPASLRVNREAKMHGKDVTMVSVFWGENLHTFAFDKANRMDANHIATVINSYMKVPSESD